MCVKCVQTDKYMKMQCKIHALKTVQKLSVERWTLHTLNECHIGDVAEATSQTLTFKMAAGDNSDLVAVHVATLYRCKLHMFLHQAHADGNRQRSQ